MSILLQMPEAEAGPMKGYVGPERLQLEGGDKRIVPALVVSISIQHMPCSRTTARTAPWIMQGLIKTLIKNCFNQGSIAA